MSTILDQSFSKAIEHLKKLNNTPSSEELLRLYGLYKQINIGDINVPKPSIFNVTGLQKWMAWKKVSGLSKDDAKFLYINFVKKIQEKDV